MGFNQIEVVKLLLAAPGASDALNSKNDGRTLLKHAIDDGHAEIKTKDDGRTPLTLAINYGHAELVALLRAAGAPE